jgi:sirohydrochlorin ferrochelatase/(2Fe-2S) ferredoxin
LAPPFPEHDRIAIVLLGHGSRERRSNVEFESLADRLRKRWPSRAVIHAYVELAQPSLAEALKQAASIANRVVILPCFLFTAGHVKNDLPLQLFHARNDFPEVQFMAARALGVHSAMVEAALDRLSDNTSPSKQRQAIVVIGRGSSDPDANGDFAKIVRLVGEAAGSAITIPAFIGIAQPSFPEALELVARSRPERLVVLPYFLFAGRLITRLEEQLADFAKRHPWIKTYLAPHLGLHHGLLDALDQRLLEALSGTSSLPCDACRYRVAISPVVNQVGGLKALLWSVRHMTTHNQAMPHLHAHRPMRKHVLVCGNVDCAARGSISLVGAMRRLIKSAGQEQAVKVTRTACMGRCGEGPTVAVYPDGIWYRGVTVDDAAELVNEHFLNDRLVARLVDAIMQ